MKITNTKLISNKIIDMWKSFRYRKKVINFFIMMYCLEHYSRDVKV